MAADGRKNRPPRRGTGMDAEKVKRVAVIGAGSMGDSIAQVFAAWGIEAGLSWKASFNPI